MKPIASSWFYEINKDFLLQFIFSCLNLQFLLYPSKNDIKVDMPPQYLLHEATDASLTVTSCLRVQRVNNLAAIWNFKLDHVISTHGILKSNSSSASLCTN